MKQQKVQAILMATDDTTDIVKHLYKSNEYEYVKGQVSVKGKTKFFQTQHIHIIPDEEIKEGDLIYDIELEEIKKASKLDCIPRLRGQINKKIIFSEDKSLGLPAPDNKSIQYIIDEFNSGKTEVYGVVDYIRQSSIGYTEDRQRTFYGAEEVKTNPDNTISIKPIEESWDDVEKNLLNTFRGCFMRGEIIQVIKELKQNYSVPTKLK